MTIEIIRQGKKRFRGSCGGCGAEFTYELEDVHHGYVGCPCCDQSVRHSGASGTCWPQGARWSAETAKCG